MLGEFAAMLADLSIPTLLFHGVRDVLPSALAERAALLIPNSTILKGSRFHNGTIEVDLAGKPAVNPVACARGFMGIAFRTQGNRQSKITQ